MVDSICGRYEAGDATNGTTLRTAETTAHIVAIKKGIAPYNWISWGKAMNDSSENEGKSGAVFLAKNMYKNSSSVTSTLCYGSQWDAMCRYIDDNNRKLPENTDSLLLPTLTGALSTDKSKNMYDLAGNCSEWTMEAVKFPEVTSRFLRGTTTSFTGPINTRGIGQSVNDAYYNTGFRITLHIK